MKEMYIWLSSPEQAAAVNLALWICMVVWLLSMAVQGYKVWRWRRDQVRRTVAAAKAQARLAVFDSWIRSGGWNTDLSSLAYDGFIREYTEAVDKHGEQYAAAFRQQVEIAEIELDKALYQFKQEFQNETQSDV